MDAERLAKIYKRALNSRSEEDKKVLTKYFTEIAFVIIADVTVEHLVKKPKHGKARKSR
jgi:hypothetical protein